MLFFKQIKENLNNILNEMDKLSSENSKDTTDKLNSLKENSKTQQCIKEFKKKEFFSTHQ